MKAFEELNELAAGSKDDTEALILDILSVHYPTLYNRIEGFDALSQNIAAACETYKQGVRSSNLGAKFASKLTQSLSINEAAKLTGYHPSSISYARSQKCREKTKGK